MSLDAGPEIEALASDTIGAALKVHSALGPGLLESAYEICLQRELVKRGLLVSRQIEIPIIFDGETIDAGYRLDLLVGGRLVGEIKSVDKFNPIHTAQLLSYLKLGGFRLGLLMNFNVPHMKDGIRRVLLPRQIESS
jgi:GxxExxY protein